MKEPEAHIFSVVHAIGFILLPMVFVKWFVDINEKKKTR